MNLFLCAYCNRTMKGHPDKKTLQDGTVVTHQYYRCNRYKVRVGERGECRNQSAIRCSDVDQPLLLHVQHTLDRIADIKEAFDRAVREGQTEPRASRLRERLASAEEEEDRIVKWVAKKKKSTNAADRFLARIGEEIAALKAELAGLEVTRPEQTEVLDEFEGINLANYSLVEKRELLSIIVKEIRLRFDRMFITYNLYESPGKLYVGRVDLDRHPAHNSKLRQR